MNNIEEVMSVCIFPSELETNSDVLGLGFTSYKIGELLYGRTYIFTIRPLYGEVEGPITSIYHRIGETPRPEVFNPGPQGPLSCMF